MALKGDLLGFYFNGHHSSEFGIVRTSDGSRFNEDLLPSFNNRTVEVPGSDGTYYFGSEYKNRTFSISFATDNITEKQYRELREWLGTKQLCQLVFDELPYKVWYVKLDKPANFKFICFDDDVEYTSIPSEHGVIYQSYNLEAGSRIYKGEGDIEFIAYYPFARCLNDYKFSEDYTLNDSPNPPWYNGNINFWKEASGLKESKNGYNTYQKFGIDIDEKSGFKVYNPGDLDTNFQLFISADSINGIYKMYNGAKQLQINVPNLSAIEDDYICINTKTNLLEGYNSSLVKTGKLYNKYITAGEFFKIPASKNDQYLINTSWDGGEPEHPFILKYDYLYY